MENSTVETYIPSDSPKRTQWWVWAIVVVVVCCCLGCIATIGVFAYLGREPENVTVNYDMPAVVNNGENFDLVLRITNGGATPITVNDIDLDEALGGSILDGSIVIDTEPFMERDYSFEGLKTFYYNQSIAPGDTATVTFHLQATTVGEFGGSVGIYVGGAAKRIDYINLIVQP